MPKQKTDPQKKHSSRKKNTQERDAWIDSDHIVNNAQRIVNSAVDILQQEIAAGILAAKKIEKKLIDVDEIRSDPNALMNRIRRDSHEVLDLVIDGFASITGQMNEILESLKREKADQKKKNTKASSKNSTPEVVVLEPDNPLKPGESVTLNFVIHEDTIGETTAITWSKSDFLGTGNQKISLRAIKIEPKKLHLSSNIERTIKIKITLPKNSKAGHYNAIITAVHNPKIRILIALDVIERTI